ncbi:MAG: DUF418 domain-containing protein [Flammeovirgaceae bacterium]
MNSKAAVLPTQEKERIQALDILRGFAVLGILFMNIQSFSMVSQAYLNPTAFGDFTDINRWVWQFSHLFADQKFMTIFSMLFGASMVMISQKAEQKTGKSMGVHYRRNFWLLVIGLIHAYVFWYGDILAPYAFCSFFIYFFRKLSIKSLWGIGLFIFSIGSVTYLLMGLVIPMIPEAEAAKIAVAWSPSEQQVNAEVAAYVGSFSEQFARRMKSALTMHTTVFLMLYLWRISGLMLIGMALYKSGFLLAKSSLKTYRLTLLIAGLVGLALVAYGMNRNFEEGWTFEYSMFLGTQFNYWGSLLMALAYISLMMLVSKTGILSQLSKRLAAVGRMALSNYLLQTFIATFIFYGFGLGLFGSLERIEQLLIVFAIYMIQLYISPIWLKYFQFGPFEWLWRSATYWKWQPLKRTA